jgi:teichuronic acid biosynthesis glycosyltransferase TuaC
MKVLFVTNMYPVPDYIYFGIHVKEQIEALEKVAPIEKQIYFINGRADKKNYFKSIKEIKRIIEHDGIDLVHVHYGLSAIFLLFFTPKVPVVLTLHSGELFRKKGYINFLFQRNISLAAVKKAQKVIVLNDDMIALLKAYENKLLKLPCGTDIDYFKETSIKKDTSKIIIGFPGNKERKEKNHKLFASIIGLLQASGKDVEVIEFHNLKRDDVVLNLNKIDLLLMTSLVEGSPQIIKEAMACNKPIVSTAVGDVEYLLNGVKNCFVVNSFEPGDFIKPVEDILNLPETERTSDGRAQLIKKGLDAESVAKSISEVYQSLR